MTTPYSAGTISLTNGSAVVTGIGTAWQTALIAGGTIYVQAAGNPLPILTVDSNTQITAALKWTGATGTYSYALIRDTAHDAQLVANATALARLLAGMEAGTIFKYNAEGDTAGRSFYDGRPKGFAYLDISVNPARLWIKSADAAGNWAGPFVYAQGAQGIPGPAGLVNWRGNYAAGTAYARNDGVYHNGSAFIALQATTGNAPPVLPTTSNAWWSVMAVKGSDGAGTGDVSGPASSVLDRVATFASASGKAIKDSGVLLGNAASRNVGTAAGTVAAGDDPRFAAAVSAALLRGYYSGLTLSNSVTAPNTQIEVAAGVANSSDNDLMMQLTAGTINCATVGANGLDAGALAANTWYHAFAIGKADGSTARLASLSPVAPTLPSGYVKKRRLGSFRTNASSQIIPFKQMGNKFLWVTPQNDYVGNDPGTATIVPALSVPAGVQVDAYIWFFLRSEEAAPVRRTALITSLEQADTVPAAGVMSSIAAGTVSISGITQAEYQVRSNTSRQIRFRLDGSGPGTSVFINTTGWIDYL